MIDFYQCSPEVQATRLEALARAALPDWGMGNDVTLELIKHRENAVFKVESKGHRYALRVHRANYHSDAELASELQWIAAINSAKLRTPQVIPTQTGSPFSHARVDLVPEPRQVDLLEWFEGAPIASVEEKARPTDVANTYSSVGRLMAITHNHSERWTPPFDFTRHAWDEDGLLGRDPFWGRYWELDALNDEQRARLEDVRMKALNQLLEFGKGEDRYGLIHADFLPENLLQGETGICLIDFDDAGFGWHLFDVATTLFFLLGEDHLDKAMGALLDGYREMRTLPEEHLDHLPLFFLLRGLTYLGWAHTRSETETAQAMTPIIVEAVDEMAKEYLE